MARDSGIQVTTRATAIHLADFGHFPHSGNSFESGGSNPSERAINSAACYLIGWISGRVFEGHDLKDRNRFGESLEC